MVRSHLPARLAAILACAAVIASCGGSGAAPTIGPGGRTPAGGASQPGQPSAPGFSFNISLPAQATWPPVGGLVRVVNLYQPGTEAPFAVDVRQTGFITQSVPIATVQPGTASPYFDPGDEGDGSTDLAFYRAGSKESLDRVMDQGWNKMKGRQITIVLFNGGSFGAPAGPSPTVRANGATYVVEERGGDNPRPTPEAGKGLLWIDTQPLNELPSGTSRVAPAIGPGDGTCLLGLGDQNGGGFSFVSGQLAFSLPAGLVSLNVYQNVSNQGECKGTPVYGPITATVEAGRESVAIIYGVDIKGLKTLVLPIGN